MEEKARGVESSEGEEQFGGVIEERVVGPGEFVGVLEVFGGKDVGIDRRKQSGGFIVGLVGAFSGCSRLSGGNCNGGIAGFGDGGRRRGGPGRV